MFIEATKSTPQILYQAGVLSIAGESYPENSFAFFEPVFAWFHQTLPTLDALTLEINLKYMNSSSTKCLLDLLDLLADATTAGKSVSVTWRYEEGNDRALDLAEEFKEDFDFPFAIVPFRDEGRP
jgi:hypothetical protein